MNESTNEGLVMIEIPCEECINGSVERIGATMPVACLHCDGAGRVELYGDDALDELERREVAKLRAAERRGIQAPTTYPDSRLNPEERREVEQRAEVAQLAAEGRSGSLARPAIAALDLDPFAVGVEVSRSSRKARTNAHPGVVAAFAHLVLNPGQARQTSVGGWAK